MIAASEPQEFIPSGRRQIVRHPGQLIPHPPNIVAPEAFLLQRLKAVSINDDDITEEWLVREAPSSDVSALNADIEFQADAPTAYRTSTDVSRDYNDEYWNCKSNESSFSTRSNRLSDAASSKISKNRFSDEPDLNRIESRSHSKILNEHIFTSKSSNFVEEELYIKGNTVIWSKGLVSTPHNEFLPSESRITLGTYSMEGRVKQALWCNFHNDRPKLDLTDLNIRSSNESTTKTKIIKCVCIMDSHILRVFTESGEDFVTNLQIPISTIWTTKYGILLEKEYSSNEMANKLQKSSCYEDQTSSIFSLSHPLDDLAPVLIHSTTNMFTQCDSTQKIVFTNDEHSLCMLYDRKTGSHSLYTLRQLKSNEYHDYVNTSANTTLNSPSTVSQKQRNNVTMPMWPSMQHITSPLAVPGSPLMQSKRPSPQTSRCPSPMSSISRQSPVLSPLLSNTTWLNRSTRLHMPINSPELGGTAEYTSRSEHTELVCKRISPEICLEHVWTDNLRSSNRDNAINGMATKVFLSTDFVGQMHFCFLIPARGRFFIARMELMNNMQFIIGIVKEFRATDALALPHLNMMAILEPDGQVILRSGLTVVGKLHVGGVSAGLSTSPGLATSAASNNLSSPFPRRSSLLPHYRTAGTLSEIKFDESVNVLSPVSVVGGPRYIYNSRSFQAAKEGETHLISLRDSVFDRITLQYTDNIYYRVHLPPLAESSLIKTCLLAIRQSLQKDNAILLIARWYATRNAPGPVNMSITREWDMFTALLLEMFGYDMERLNWGVKQQPTRSNSPTAKRKRTSDQGDISDWMEIIKSDLNIQYEPYFGNLLMLENSPPELTAQDLHLNEGRINTSSVLFPYMPLIFYTLHLVYEELKLNMLASNDLEMMVPLLHLLARDLRLDEYVAHYWTDYPTLYPLKINETVVSQIDCTDLAKMNQFSFLDSQPANIMNNLYRMMSNKEIIPYPYIPNVNSRSKDVVRLCAMIFAHRKGFSIEPQIESLIRLVITPGSRYNKKSILKDMGTMSLQCNLVQNAVILMADSGFTRYEIENLPAGINLLLHEALWQCRENPPFSWPSTVYELLDRMDLAAQNDSSKVKKVRKTAFLANDEKLQVYSEPSQEDLRCPYFFANNTKNDVQDGMENMDLKTLKLRFPKDHRVTEIRRLLQSATPVSVNVVQRHEVTDHDYIEELEKHLYAICSRTMALPVGRGMFTLRTTSPVITETLPIPRLCLGGRAPPRDTAVELSHIDTPPNMNLWPLFHNGVAAGLRIHPNASNIDSTWIVFNKPKSSQDAAEHAGFLMALGLNGHLKNLTTLYTYEYLVKINELTSIGVLLGLAATKRGTMHTVTTKMLSIHVEALLPPTSMELDVPQNIQVAALLGIGLVYERSSHRHIIEVLLAEIGRPPGPEMENSVDRESYSLAAGLALGLVTLGQGGKSSGLADLAVSDTLHYYMAGGNRRPMTGSQKDKYKVPSFQIREGSCVNLDVTAPGATLALGLMYLGSGSKAIADWMRPPDTQYLLDFVRPDLLLLRIVARALILWDDITPSCEWVEGQIPVAIRPYCLVKPEPDMDPNIDFEAMNQVYCNIIAGACFALGLRFAGSANEDAAEVLHHYCRMFVSLTGKSIAELAGKPTIESCLNLILLSFAMVMAGTGDLSVMRFVRHLRRRVNPASSATVTYGAHLSMHMALGLLFLGGGRLTLSSSPSAVAAMLCAFFPKFPTHSNDNRYHLQAFRHLYVLAVEPRLIIPRDILNNKPCYTNLTIVSLDGHSKKVKAPCILPELCTLKTIAVDDDRYWPVVFEKERNWEQLLHLLTASGYLDVKQRAGCFSYIQDPTGTKSLIGRSITQSQVMPWCIDFTNMASFSSNKLVKLCINQYLTPTASHPQSDSDDVDEDNSARHTLEMQLKQIFSTFTYECVTKDKLALLPTLINAVQTINNLKYYSNTASIWQLKLICAQVLSETAGKSLISQELAISFQQQVTNILDSWQDELKEPMKRYLSGNGLPYDSNIQSKLAKYVVFYDIPYNLQVENQSNKFQSNMFALLHQLNKYNLSNHTIYKIINNFSK